MIITALKLVIASSSAHFTECPPDALLLNETTLVQSNGNRVWCSTPAGKLIAEVTVTRDDVRLTRQGMSIFAYTNSYREVQKVSLINGKLVLQNTKMPSVKVDGKNFTIIEGDRSINYSTGNPILESESNRYSVELFQTLSLTAGLVSEIVYKAESRQVLRSVFILKDGSATKVTDFPYRNNVILFAEGNELFGASTNEDDSNIELLSGPGSNLTQWHPFVWNSQTKTARILAPSKSRDPSVASFPVAANSNHSKVLAKSYRQSPNGNREENLIFLTTSGQSDFPLINFEGQKYKAHQIIDSFGSTVIVATRTANSDKDKAFVFRIE